MGTDVRIVTCSELDDFDLERKRFVLQKMQYQKFSSNWTQTFESVVSYRVVAVVAGNSDTVTLSGLKADTQYQVTVAAIWAGKRYRSRPIVFRTLGLMCELCVEHMCVPEPPRSSPQQDPMAAFSTESTSTREKNSCPPTWSSTHRPVRR
ncbi:hypothetical protein NQ317_009000 [Molorchus minor]|uniref:Fibronectin type-III domain-containing protein n=1 Tax=Molorchus minor TaxID=1323400 RepID=A0ABQ9JUK7_9CUCU|nr:hypothetical protein NQ317_009000 [Molorchus minor]